MNNLHPFRIPTGYEPGFCAFKLLIPSVTTISHSVAVARMTERSINTISSHALSLTEENFSDWLIDIRAYLRSKKLWKYTQEQYVSVPEEGETAAAVKKREKEQTEWKEKAEEAANIITPIITPAIKKKLTEVKFNDGQKMLVRLSTIL